MPKFIPTKFLDMIPLPILVSQQNKVCPNHTHVYLNKSFADSLGWTLEDIPNKASWWQKAYPDPQYQKVVERLWETSVEVANFSQDEFILVTVNINTKYNGVKRYKVYTELKTALLDGYHMVAFEEVK